MPESTTPTRHDRRRKMAVALALLAILLVGGAFRFYNVNWDEGTYHIHPDERHTAMVITAIQWPATLGEYFDTSRSPLNPRNANTVFFYGTLPLFLTKAVATLLDRTGYDQVHLVGRVLSALFDLGSVLLLFFLARRLFNRRVGLVASCLLALTVLNIQGSHYFAVDTFLTFFVLLTLWFTLDVAEGKGWSAYAALGVGMGMTLACKVSVFLLAVVVALGVWLWVRRRVSDGEPVSATFWRAVLGLALAVVLALVVFRVAQPYAWAGPNYDGWDSVPQPWSERLRVLEKLPDPVRAVIMPNPRWIADIVEAGAQQTGEADMPWGRQWTDRTPWLFPLENMVVWGMGVPLGVASWMGVILLIVHQVCAWRKRRSLSRGDGLQPAGLLAPVWLSLAWVLLTFFWQGMQFVKSVRYFLPIYPCLAMFAAYLIVSAWDRTKRRRWLAQASAGALAAVVLLGTLAWAFAFIQIYREPVTRVQATRWMYENVETGATLHYQTSDGQPGQVQIPVPSEHTYRANGLWLVTPFTVSEDLLATEVVMNNLTGLEGPSEGLFEVAITTDDPELAPLAEAQIGALFGGDGGRCYALDIPDTSLEDGRLYFLKSRAVRGAPLVSLGSAIANEHFDDPLPFNMDGRTAFGAGPYRGLDLTLYDEDTPEKLSKLLDVLDEADYISMSSGRLWQSIPRLPMRYPVTTRYYELLFAGEMGFEKAAEFHSYPRLFGIEFDDTWAEEQFTVYDHPKVLIYRKTDDYDRDRALVLLSAGVDWDQIPHWLNPRDVDEWRREQARQERDEARQQTNQEQKRDLMLSEEQQQVQVEGGTWASIFQRNSLPNRWPTLLSLLVVGALGLAALPLTVAVFGRLPDRGYLLARPAGVLLLAWLSWILTNLTPLHYSRGTITLALGLIMLGSLVTLWWPRQRRRLVKLWRGQARLILVSEILFLLFFALFWLIRWANPDLWHAWKGGEKPMDFAYLNAVIKSTEFPPYDPWFAGGYLNYYYFGQVMVGSLIKWIGIVPSVAYNLVIPLWFAMTAMGAFSVAYNFAARSGLKAGDAEGTDDGALQHRSILRPVLVGLVGALFVAVLGNLGQIHLLLLKLGQGVMDTFQSTIPGLAALVRVVIGFFEVMFGGRALPIGIDEWYWNASRAIPAGPHESVITEFPFFTFLYADLHAHLIALPLTVLSLSLALALALPRRPRGDNVATGGQSTRVDLLWRLCALLLWSLAIGAMRTSNTWDVPPHLLIVLGAVVIREFSDRQRFSWRLVTSVAWQWGLVFVLSWFVLYRPFWINYGPFYNSVALWTGTRTPIWAYLIVHGLFLFAVVSYLLVQALDRGGWVRGLLRRLALTIRYRQRLPRLKQAARIARIPGLPVGRLIWMGLGILILLEIVFLVPGLLPLTRAKPDAAEAGVFAYRGLSTFALGLPVALVGLGVLLRPGLSPSRRLWAYLVLLGLAMSLGVEVIVIQGDIGRMNTVFKFYLQVWVLWGIAAAVALNWMIPSLRRWMRGRTLWVGMLALLLFCAALYPPLATMAKVRDRFDAGSGPGLDGWAYMETAIYRDPVGQEYELKWDLDAIGWMLDNIVGSPVILEGHTPEYRWGARYSINTGLPTVVGWNWHQRQQRAAADDQVVWERVGHVETIYNTAAAEVAEPLLSKYGVRYIVVGPLERAYYAADGLRKFEAMVAGGTLRIAFRNEQVTIYEVAR